MPNKKFCCNPFDLPNHNWVKKNVGKSTPELLKKLPNLGEYVCFCCRIKILKDAVPSKEVSNSIIKSPLNETKFSNVKTGSEGNPSPNISSDEDSEVYTGGDDGLEMLLSVKKKFQTISNYSEKIFWLTISPPSWTAYKLQKEFNTTYKLASHAKKTQNMFGFGSHPTQKISGRKISENDISVVQNFYRSDDISRLMPGQNDCVSVRQTDGKKSKIQKRLVLCNLKEAYVEFKNMYPDLKVGFSKFAELRPRECILADAAGTHTVCVCKIHQNFKLMMDALKDISNQISIQTYEDVLREMTCEKFEHNCQLRKCNSCPGFEGISIELGKAFEVNNIKSLEFLQWTNTDRSSIETVNKDTHTFIEMLKADASVLLTHNFIAKSQNKFFKELKLQLKEGEFIVVGDFSENFTFLVQNAIQDYHWNSNQVTVHPFVVYRAEKDKNKSFTFESFVLISECNIHDTTAVYLFQKKMINWLVSKYNNDNVKKIYYFSDGAVSQYKNKYNFINLMYHFQDFNIKAEWHFFATSHGKNACDGIGGTVKRFVRRESLRRPDSTPITTPIEFFNTVKNEFKTMQFGFCSKADYQKEKDFLKDRFATAVRINGTRSFHSFIPFSSNEIKCKVVSTCNESDCKIFKVIKKLT